MSEGIDVYVHNSGVLPGVSRHAKQIYVDVGH